MATYLSDIKLWAVDLASVGISDEKYLRLLDLLPPHVTPEVTKFVFEKDRHRALISRLLQRNLVSQVLNVDFDSVSISRTREVRHKFVVSTG